MTCGLPDGGCFSLSALPSIRLSASSIRSPLSREAASAAGAGSLTAAGSTRLVNLLLLISVLSCRVQHPNTPTPDFRTEFFRPSRFRCWGVGVLEFRSHQHVKTMRSANDLLCPRHLAAATDDQHTALLKLPRDLGGIEAVAVAAPHLSTDQDAVGLDVPVKKLGCTLPKLVSLADRHPFTAASANMDEAIAETGYELVLNLARGPHDFAGSVEIAALRHPAAHAGDDAHIGILDGPGQQACRYRHAQGCGLERKAVDDRAHLRMRLLIDGMDLSQRQECLAMLR